MSKSIRRVHRHESFEDDNLGIRIHLHDNTYDGLLPQSVTWDIEVLQTHAGAVTTIVANGSSDSWDRAITDATETGRLLRTVFPKP